MKTFTIRIDLESDKGIKAVPKLLDLLKKYDLKACFYLVMGGESNILEMLKYRKKLGSSGERKIKVWSLAEKTRMVLLPQDFTNDNKKILRRILDEEHELGIHGWKHREWTRGLEKINIEKRILMAKKKYFKLFGRLPISFSSPGYNMNKKTFGILEKTGIEFISDFPGKKAKKYGKIKNVPITIQGEKNMPIIEWLVGSGKNDGEILEYFREEIKKNELASFYMHGLFEARFKLKLLEEIFKFVKRNKIKNKRIIDY